MDQDFRDTYKDLFGEDFGSAPLGIKRKIKREIDRGTYYKYGKRDWVPKEQWLRERGMYTPGKRPYYGAQGIGTPAKRGRYGDYNYGGVRRTLWNRSFKPYYRRPYNRYVGGYKRTWRSAASNRIRNAKKIEVFNTQSLREFTITKVNAADTFAKTSCSVNLSTCLNGTNKDILDMYISLYDEFKIAHTSTSVWFKNTDNLTSDTKDSVVEYTHCYDADANGRLFRNVADYRKVETYKTELMKPGKKYSVSLYPKFRADFSGGAAVQVASKSPWFDCADFSDALQSTNSVQMVFENLPVDSKTETNIVGRQYFKILFRGKRNGQTYE